MPKNLPKRDPSAAYVRQAISARRVAGRKCACGEERPGALVSEKDPIICYECLSRENGRATVEDHHVAGAANNPTTIPVPGNDHRADLNAAQYDWPKKTLENPEGSPLLARAGCIRGYIDTNDYLIRQFVQADPEFYECLDAFLTEKFGPQWWVNTRLEKFAPKR
jgi:hypothetical protein